MPQDQKQITIKVEKGTKVTIEEVATLTDDDPRMRHDRDVHIIAPESLKIAVKRVAAPETGASANVVTMCG